LLDTLNSFEYGALKAAVLNAALELDVFTVIDGGRHGLDEIADSTHADKRGMQILLDALCPLGLLAKSKKGYLLTPTSEAFLVRGKPAYYGTWMLEAGLGWGARGRAAECIRTGKPVGFDASGSEADKIWASDVAPHVLVWSESAERAREMWRTVGVGRQTYPGARILDVACGSGVNGFALAQDDKKARVTSLDLNPKVLDVAARVAKAMGVERQVSLRRANVLDGDLGSEEYDVVLLGRILYYFQPEQVGNILRRAYRALKPGGLVVISSYVADEERCRAETALLVAFQLLIFAPWSRVYTFAEYKEMLDAQGFADVKQYGDALVAARKEGPKATGDRA
jgi:C-methyltransferase